MPGIRAYSPAVAESCHGCAVNFAQRVLNVLQHLPFSTVDIAFLWGTGRITEVQEAKKQYFQAIKSGKHEFTPS